MKLLSKLIVTLFVFSAASAFAQWQYLDKDGRKVFSDRAPPVDVPEKNILKRPAGRNPNANAVAVEPTADAGQPTAAAVPAANTPKLSGVDKDLEAKKKQAADAEAAKKKADEERLTKARIENCARAKQAKTTYDSGLRISRTNANGEKEILDDTARAAELKRIQAIIDSDCK
jgi:hypothetical protein